MPATVETRFALFSCCVDFFFALHCRCLCFILVHMQAMERVSLGSVKVAAILLVGLFAYDVAWVFG